MAYTKNAKEIVEQFKAANREQYDELVKLHGDDPRASIVKAISVANKRLDAAEAEQKRTKDMYSLILEQGPDKIVVGIDEVGRGALAGPLTVGAVVLSCEPMILGLNDSKKLSPARREALYPLIRQRALAIGISHVPPATIDSIGITAAVRYAMRESLDSLEIDPDLVLIDGNPVNISPKERCIVKGDAKVACIAAASIVAKVTRDRIMVEADSKYPGYHFADSKGYGSELHIKAIEELGLTDFHRRSFCGHFMQGTLF